MTAETNGNRGEMVNFQSEDSMFVANHEALYHQMDDETLNDLLRAAYSRYNESERIIPDIELEKRKRRNGS